jgi:hypothetical protein
MTREDRHSSTSKLPGTFTHHQPTMKLQMLTKTTISALTRTARLHLKIQMIQPRLQKATSKSPSIQVQIQWEAK